MKKPNYNLKAREILNSENLYCTKPRIVILKTLLKAEKPLTEKELSMQSGPDSPDKVTIYRTLKSLCKLGLVHEAYVHKKQWHFELANHCGQVQCHPHFTCKSCGTTTCMTESIVPIVKGLKKGFVLYRQQVRLEGLCPACASKAKKAS